jgi:hypothetical protein
MPWYSTEHVEDTSILRLKGDASTRHFQCWAASTGY